MALLTGKRVSRAIFCSKLHTDTVFGKNSTFRVIPMAAAKRCNVRIEGLAFPVSLN